MNNASPAAQAIEDGRREDDAASLALKLVNTPSLPSGTVTFLLTDIEGSTALWQQIGEAFRPVLERHHEMLLAEVGRAGGLVFKEAGDGFLVAFGSARDAVACAIACQRALAKQEWPVPGGSLWVRMAIHTGDVAAETSDYHSLVLHHAARLMGAAHGGQILCSEPTAALLGGNALRQIEPGAELRDLGRYRLRDIPEAQSVFAVCYPGQPERGWARPRATRPYTPTLPVSLTRFFGREDELARLQALLAPGGNRNRLVTLTGPGGTGKTRLAIQAGDRLAADYDGAVWFVPLADVNDPRRLADAVRDALPDVPPASDEPTEQIARFLSEQPALLVLDNVEHLVEAAAEFVHALLTRVSNVACLVTSRQPLGIGGEREFPVAPLPVPSGATGVEPVVVRLFLDRAQLVRPDFALTGGNTAAVAGICTRLEGIPLAIELAAARVTVLTPAQILAQIENRFRLLVTSRRDVPARHRSLRAAVEYSYHLLSPDHQRFFRTLSVFRGGFTLEAAAHVTDDPFALESLEHLGRCSLLYAEPGGPEGPAEMRFRLLETLRAFANEHLAGEEREIAGDRHRDWFLSLAERAEPELSGRDQADWLRRLETEHDNLRAALDLPRSDEPRLRLAAALHRFWMVRGHLREGGERLASALAGCDDATEAVRAKALNGAGILAWASGDLDTARGRFQNALESYREQQDLRGSAKTLANLGIAASQQGDFVAAREALHEALVICREHGDASRVATVLSNLAAVALQQHDPDAAQRFLEECLPVQRTLDDRFGLSNTLHNLAMVHRDRNDLTSALACVAEGLTLRHSLNDSRSIAESFELLAEIALIQSSHERAACLLSAAAAIRAELSAPVAPSDRERKDTMVAKLRARMQVDRFDEHWETGGAMSLDQAVDYALEPPRMSREK